MDNTLNRVGLCRTKASGKTTVLLLVSVFICCAFYMHRDLIYTEHQELSIFSQDGIVRECITGRKVGRVQRTGRQNFKTLGNNSPAVLSRSDTVAGSRRKAFDDIFVKRVWGSSNDTNSGVSASGPGSVLSFTHEVTATLHVVITQLKRRLGVEKIRLLDMPCGDMGWMSRFLEMRADVNYTGVDIVKNLIDRHRKTFAERDWTFINIDFVSDPIPFDDYDVILSRMALQHLPTSAVLRVLSRMSAVVAASNRKHPNYLLTTSFQHTAINEDIVDGRFQTLNIEIPPVSLTPPLCMTRDGPLSYQLVHHLGLWSLPLTTVTKCNVSANIVAEFGRNLMYSCTPLTRP